MASIADRVRWFLRSPQGRRLVARAEYELRQPRNQRRLAQLAARLRRLR